MNGSEKEVSIMGDRYTVRATIEEINAFSAHADYQETIDWLNTIDTSRLKRIYMVHGEPDVQEEFQRHLADAGYNSVQIVKYGETYDLEALI